MILGGPTKQSHKLPAQTRQIPDTSHLSTPAAERPSATLTLSLSPLCAKSPSPKTTCRERTEVRARAPNPVSLASTMESFCSQTDVNDRADHE